MEEIENKYARMSAERFPTMAMADLYESHRDLSNEYVTAFCPVNHQIGMVVFIDGEVAGLEVLAKYETFNKVNSKLVNSYVMDALETAQSELKPKMAQSRTKAARILEFAGNALVERRNSVALGKDLRLESDEVIGVGLEFEGQVLQVTLFPKAEDRRVEKRGNALRQASHRRTSIKK